VLEQTSESLTTNHLSHGGLRPGFNKLVGKPLMVPLLRIVLEEFKDGLPQWLFSEPDHSTQALRLDGTHETLRMCIRVRGLEWCSMNLHSLWQHCAELLAVFGVSIANEEAFAHQESWQTTSCLGHESVVRMPGESTKMHSASLQIQEKQHVMGSKTAFRPDLDGKEI